jgi:hypothetical protein
LCGTSEVSVAVENADPGATGLPQRVDGLASGGATLQDVLIEWRRQGVPVRVVLPVAGDVRGLSDPAPFRDAALHSGEAVLCGTLAVVPTVERHPHSGIPFSVQWQAYEIEAAAADFIQLSEAQYELTTAIRESATALAAADIAGHSGGDISGALHDARRVGEHITMPPRFPAAAIALLAQAERMQAVLDLALADDTGGAVSRSGIEARAEGLRPLIVAARRARLAAYNSTADRTA